MTWRIILAGLTLTTCVLWHGVAANAQTTPSLTISPTSGPCDATVEITLGGFAPNEKIRLDVARPSSGDVVGPFDVVSADSSGSFSGQRSLGAAGCQAAANDDALQRSDGRKTIFIFAGYDANAISVKARTEYLYTTTSVSTTTALPTTPAATEQTAQPTPNVGDPSAGSSSSRALLFVILASAAGIVLLGVIFFAISSRRRNRG